MLGLFDGGDFIAEVNEGVQDFQEDVCPVGDWLFQKRKVQLLRIVKWKKLSMKTNLLAWKNWRLNMLEMRKSLIKLLSFPAQNIHHLIFPGTDVLVAICNAVSMEVGQSRLVEG